MQKQTNSLQFAALRHSRISWVTGMGKEQQEGWLSPTRASAAKIN